jgi:hypothetical protein
MKDPIYKGIAVGLQVAFAKTEIVAWLTSKARSRKLNVRAFCGDYYFASDVPARMYRIARPVSQLSTPIIMRLPNKTKLVDLKLPTSSQIQITTIVVKPAKEFNVAESLPRSFPPGATQTTSKPSPRHELLAELRDRKAMEH